MDFITAVKTCFKKYFAFSGRARRSEYWYWILFTIIAAIVLGLLDLLFFGIPFTSDEIQPLSDIFTLATFIPGLSVTWRRLHDTGRSGWWVGGPILAMIVLAFGIGIFIATSGGFESLSESSGIVLAILIIIFIIVLIVWAIVLLVFYCMDTIAGDNKYGEDPKYGQRAALFD